MRFCRRRPLCLPCPRRARDVHAPLRDRWHRRFRPGGFFREDRRRPRQAWQAIVVRSGGYEEGVAKALFKQATVKTLTADQAGIITLEIASGRADAGAGGYYGNLVFLKSNPNVKVRVLSDDLLSKTSIAYAVPP